MNNVLAEKISEYILMNPDATEIEDKELNKELYDSLRHNQTVQCVFCGKIPCEHWDGLTFNNPNC